jgi:hypothetical protein
MKENIHNWLTEQMRITGMLGCGIRCPDRRTFTRSASAQFTPVAMEHACRCLSDTFQVISSNRFPVQLVRWVYENYLVYGFMRDDGLCLALLTRRHEATLQNADIENIVAEFHSLAV